jgi:hypothetical protein
VVRITPGCNFTRIGCHLAAKSLLQSRSISARQVERFKSIANEATDSGAVCRFLLCRFRVTSRPGFFNFFQICDAALAQLCYDGGLVNAASLMHNKK